MAFHLDRNPLEQNPLFSAAPPESAENALQGRSDAKVEKNTSKPVSPRKSQSGGSEDYQRATFIVRRDLLTRLKDYAYTERRELKEIINEILEAALDDIAEEYRKDGRTFATRK